MTHPPDWIRTRPIAHRGLHDHSAGVPENSLLAFDAAAKDAYPIELDVRLLADGNVVVFHDKDLNRMVGQNRPIAECSAGELMAMRLLGTSERIPLLTDVLDRVAGRTPLLIEVKNESRTDWRPEQALAGLLDGYGGPVAVQSFNPFSMEWFKDHRPMVARGQLADDSRDEDLRPHTKLAPLGGLLDLRAEPAFIAYDIHGLPRECIERERRAGLAVVGWTCRCLEDEQAARLFCDNVIFEGYRPR